MTRELREAFSDLLDEEPPLHIDVADLVRSGRRLRTRRRLIVSGVVAGTVPLLAAVSLGLVSLTGSSGSTNETEFSGPVPPTTAPSQAVASPSTEPTRAASRAPSIGQGIADPDGESTAPASSHDEPTDQPRPSPRAPSSPPVNLLADPGFEGDPPGWRTFGPATTLAVDDRARSGEQALRITTSLTGTGTSGATADPTLVRTVAGATYTGSCWVRSDVELKAHVQLQEYTTDWKRAGDAAPSPAVELSDPDRWYLVSVTYTAAADGNLLPFSVFSHQLRDGYGALIVDDCTLFRHS